MQEPHPVPVLDDIDHFANWPPRSSGQVSGTGSSNNGSSVEQIGLNQGNASISGEFFFYEFRILLICMIIVVDIFGC